nr:hypothetical protein [Streptomyces oceani]
MPEDKDAVSTALQVTPSIMAEQIGPLTGHFAVAAKHFGDCGPTFVEVGPGRFDDFVKVESGSVGSGGGVLRWGSVDGHRAVLSLHRCVSSKGVEGSTELRRERS